MEMTSAERQAKNRARNAARQAKYRARQAAGGFVNVTLQVPAHAVAGMTELARLLRQYPDCAPGPARNERTGKLVSLKH